MTVRQQQTLCYSCCQFKSPDDHTAVFSEVKYLEAILCRFIMRFKIYTTKHNSFPFSSGFHLISAAALSETFSYKGKRATTNVSG